MFGYSRRDFLNQNLNIIIPEPIASAHQQFLVNYMMTGREVCARACACLPLRGREHWPRPQVMIGASRTMFARHSQGYLFPILINAQPMESCFAGCIQRLKTEDEFVWFYTKSFTVCGASQQSYAMMGVRGRGEGWGTGAGLHHHVPPHR